MAEPCWDEDWETCSCCGAYFVDWLHPGRNNNTFHRDILSKQTERAMIQRVPTPPAYCTAMVIMAQTAPYPGWWAPVQVSSALISQRFNIPTLNGLSGWTPKGWPLDNPGDPAYRDQAVNWAKEHDVLHGLCAYVTKSRTEAAVDVDEPSKAPSRGDGKPAADRP